MIDTNAALDCIQSNPFFENVAQKELFSATTCNLAPKNPTLAMDIALNRSNAANREGSEAIVIN